MSKTPHKSKVQVCGIGASAGGVTALKQLFEAIDPDLGLAYVVILHLDPTHRSQMQEILTQTTSMPVHEVSDTRKLEANNIYVIAPDRELEITDHHVTARDFNEPRGQRAPIDVFFRSLANGQADGLAVILSGAGSDGAVGVRAVKEAGGVVFVQEPADAEYPVMPRSAIATGAADFIVPLAGMAKRIADVVHSKTAIRLDDEDVDDTLRHIISFLRARTGHDFGNYKRATVLRRITRRMQVAHKESLSDYADYLAATAEEAQELFGDLLISVTMFFRDPHAFDILAEKGLDPLLEGRGPDDTIRVWVAGCATGEEAFSIAILLREAMERHDLHCPVQIFATDLDDGALATGREGRYPTSIEADVSDERLARHFVHEGSHYRVRKDLREMVLFASHSILKDPPFMKLDLITCRNLLIYLDRPLQRQVCATFHYVLNPRGLLFLGSAESIDHVPELYRPVDREARLFHPKPHAPRRLPMLGAEQDAHVPFVSPPPPRAHERDKSAMTAHSEALEELAPPSILVGEDGQVVHLSDTAGRFLLPSKGTLSLELPALVRPELRLDLQTALGRAFDAGQPTLTLPLQVAFDEGRHRVGMYVRPLPDDERSSRRALVVFLSGGKMESGEIEADGKARLSKSATADLVPRLYEELRQTQDRLSNSRRDHESAVQELRAANEELQSINEEYRSTSEELETSKEELQSINEELQTVNAELKSKLESISSAHSDLQNLIAATDIGTLFLDPGLRIKLFTPEVTHHFNITEVDIGRAITDFTHNFICDGVDKEAKAVLSDLVPRETEVATRDGRWLLLRLRPYRTIDDRIDGVVISLLDITERRKTLMDLRETTELLSMATSASLLGWGAWERDAMLSWDERGQEVMALDNETTSATELLARIHSDDRDRIRSLLRTCMTSGDPFDVSFRIVRKDRSVRHVQATGAFASGNSGQPLRGTGLVRDITEQVTWADSQRLLIGELNHRVKNMLAVVSSIASQTARHTGSKEDFVLALRQRIKSLAKAHSLLTDNNWVSTNLSSVIENMIETFVEDRERFHVTGPPVHLTPQATLSLTMVLHELSTNAAKYGALSLKDGAIDIKWTITDSARPMLTLLWQERGGPAVTPPERKGFGTRLLSGGAAQELDGEICVEYASKGVVCRIEFPLDGQKFDEERLPLPQPSRDRG